VKLAAYLVLDCDGAPLGSGTFLSREEAVDYANDMNAWPEYEGHPFYVRRADYRWTRRDGEGTDR